MTAARRRLIRWRVHPGLYIVDGSTMPGALAANPTLTISAQAIKAVERAVGPLPL
jgi:choline dehydrogenase-like flavoprotein